MAISRIESNSIAPSQTLTTPIIATTMGVGGATPAGSGSGITFPATQSASTDANTLDDYEEGSWTPTVSSGTIVPLRPRYTKIGRLVTVSAYVGTFSDTSSSNTVEIGGLPFPTGDVEGVGSFFARYVTVAICATYAGSGSGTLLRFYNTSSGAYTPLLHNQFNNASAQIYFEVTYAASA